MTRSAGWRTRRVMTEHRSVLRELATWAPGKSKPFDNAGTIPQQTRRSHAPSKISARHRLKGWLSDRIRRRGGPPLTPWLLAGQSRSEERRSGAAHTRLCRWGPRWRRGSGAATDHAAHNINRVSGRDTLAGPAVRAGRTSGRRRPGPADRCPRRGCR